MLPAFNKTKIDLSPIMNLNGHMEFVNSGSSPDIIDIKTEHRLRNGMQDSAETVNPFNTFMRNT